MPGKTPPPTDAAQGYGEDDFGDPIAGSLPADVVARIRATDWTSVLTRAHDAGVPVKVPVPATLGDDGYKNEGQAKSNRAYDVLAAIVSTLPEDHVMIGDHRYKVGTKRTSYADGIVTVRVLLKPAKP